MCSHLVKLKHVTEVLSVGYGVGKILLYGVRSMYGVNVVYSRAGFVLVTPELFFLTRRQD
jgi:hypothetical protein